MEKTFILILLLVASKTYGQLTSNFNSSKNWSMNKKEIFFTAGATQFLGDLGGRDKIGTQNSLADIDWGSTRMGFGFGYRFRFHPMFATSTHLYAGLLSGDDSKTNEIVRRSRNLHFRSPVVELSQRIEFNILANEKIGARYRINGAKGARYKADILYVFTGIGGTFFNPQANINGSWENLRDLKTEGQGLSGGPDEYSKITASIPLGIGFKLGIGQFWRIGMEFSYHKTFTDYMDDVSGNYYDPDILASEIGANAAYASNPAIENQGWFAPGQQRGNPDDDDAFFLANIVVTRNITYSKPKGGKRVKWKGRTKF